MSLNRGMFFTFKTKEEKEKCIEKIKELIMGVEEVENCIAMNDEEIINVSATLADNIKKSMAEFQKGELSEAAANIYEDPTFLEKFMKSIVINATAETTVTKIVFIDRTNSRNITDTEIIQLFMKLTKELKHDGVLHIPGGDEKGSQLNLFYQAEKNILRIERNGLGSPAIKLFICKQLTPEEAVLHGGNDKRIKELTFPFNCVAQTYDDMLSFIIDEDYDELNLGISRSKEDNPILTPCTSLEELYDIVCLMTSQMEFYGILERDVVDTIHKYAASEVVEETAE